MTILAKRACGWLILIVLAVPGQAFGQASRAAEEVARLLSKLGGGEARVAERLVREMSTEARMAQRMIRYQTLCENEAVLSAERFRTIERLSQVKFDGDVAVVTRRRVVCSEVPPAEAEKPVHEAVQKLGEESEALKEVRGTEEALESTSAETELCHLTSESGEAGINESHSIIGRHGIFVVPKSVANARTIRKVWATGLSPNCVVRTVQVPSTAVGLFRRPIPIGPYSLWKFAGGVRYAAPGSLNITTGAFKSAPAAIGPEVLLYGPDAIFWTGVGAAVVIYDYATSEQK